MTLYKNKYPVLEYDNDPAAVLMPSPHQDIQLPVKCVVTFSDYSDRYAKQVNAKILGTFLSCSRAYNIFAREYKGHSVCFCDIPAGASAAVQLADYLFLCGVRHIIASGSCGCLVNIPENEILIPVKALRDEGTSYHYLKPQRFIHLNLKAIKAIEMALGEISRPYRKCITWTTDAFFRETKKMVEYRKKEGCQVVEMECSALAACAEFREKIFGQILFSGDSLADTEKYDQRNWGASSIESAFDVAMRAVVLIS